MHTTVHDALEAWREAIREADQAMEGSPEREDLEAVVEQRRKAYLDSLGAFGQADARLGGTLGVPASAGEPRK